MWGEIKQQLYMSKIELEQTDDTYMLTMPQ